MTDLMIGGMSFAAGGGLMLGLALWHQKRLRRAVAAERRAGSAERDKLQGQLSRLQEDLRFYQDKAAGLQAAQSLATEYDQGYVDGMRHGAELSDVDRLAVALDQKRPGRLLRMDKYHRQGAANA